MAAAGNKEERSRWMKESLRRDASVQCVGRIRLGKKARHLPLVVLEAKPHTHTQAEGVGILSGERTRERCLAKTNKILIVWREIGRTG